jgi:hypothetical protein
MSCSSKIFQIIFVFLAIQNYHTGNCSVLENLLSVTSSASLLSRPHPRELYPKIVDLTIAAIIVSGQLCSSIIPLSKGQHEKVFNKG